MTSDILEIIGFIILLSSPLIAIAIGLTIRNMYPYNDDGWYMGTFTICAVCGIFLMALSAFIRTFEPVDVYDVEIRVHYVDGYSTIMRRDSITNKELPCIEEDYIYSGIPGKGGSCKYLGTYSLYFGQQLYRGVIRFEYLKKRKYFVEYDEYSEYRKSKLERRKRKQY